MSVAFYALRTTRDGEAPVVLKVLRPSFVQQAGPTAALIVKKEAIALGRLNERVPPTPFVVRFVDTGCFSVDAGGRPLELPFVVVEYVHGGAEGTTLTERIASSLRGTGFGFDPARAAHLVEGIAAGLMAVHEVGVIHRDLKPDNVLCCGFADEEIFKIADFGVARPAGVAATFGGIIVGTLGFAAPELTTNDPKAIGPWSDVFSFGSMVYYALTGEELFAVTTPAEALIAAVTPQRRSIRDARGLAPELRGREQACRSIDFAIACATSGKIENRPQRADALAAMLVPWLREESRRPGLAEIASDRAASAGAARVASGNRVARGRLDQLREAEKRSAEDPTVLVRWSWTTLRNPGTGRIVRSVAWDGDGRCMVATDQGLTFWNGDSYADASLAGYPHPNGIRFVRRVAAGQFILGGDGASLAMVTPEGIREVREIQGYPDVRFELFSGEIDDIAVLVGTGRGEPPTLYALVGTRWLKPLPVPEVASLSAMARLDDARWLLAGRGVDGRGFVGVYSPLDWSVTRMSTPEVRAFLACAGQWEHGLGVTTGAGGAVVFYDGERASHEHVDGAYDLSAAGVDAVGRAWTASAGRLWLRREIGAPTRGSPSGRWDCIWSDATWHAPIVSIFNDVGVVIAMTADGGIIEGRAERYLSSPPRGA
jgi:hypothetical protein